MRGSVNIGVGGDGKVSTGGDDRGEGKRCRDGMLRYLSLSTYGSDGRIFYG